MKHKIAHIAWRHISRLTTKEGDDDNENRIEVQSDKELSETVLLGWLILKIYM